MHDLCAELSFTVPLVSGSRECVAAVPVPGTRVVLPRDDSMEIYVELPHFVFAPLEAGEHAGALSMLRDGKALCRVPLVYAESAALADAR